MAKEKTREEQSRGLAPWRRPFSEMARIDRDLEETFGNIWGRLPFGLGLPWRRRLIEDLGVQAPAVEVFEEKDEVVMRAELPGMKKEDIDLNITENFVTIKGEKKKEEERKKEGYYYSECSFGSFERSVAIPREVQIDKAKATFKDGVLEVRLPKTEEAKRKETKIKIE